MNTLHIVPVGRIEVELLQTLCAAIPAVLHIPCEILPYELDPAPSYHPERQQYHSSEILYRMQTMVRPHDWRFLAIANVDLYIPILKYVFGEAQMGGPCAVVSIHRLRQEFYGLAPDLSLLQGTPSQGIRPRTGAHSRSAPLPGLQLRYGLVAFRRMDRPAREHDVRRLSHPGRIENPSARKARLKSEREQHRHTYRCFRYDLCAVIFRIFEVTMQGQTALVTGASRGIGKEIALELARNGYRVAMNYFDDAANAEATAAEIRALPAEVLPIEADIRSSSQVTAMFERVIGAFGRLDLLVNNAGVQTWKPLLDVTEEEWDLVVDTNLKGCFLCTQQAARHMKAHGGGSIVNLGSGCNKLAFPSLVAYTASKGGIEMFTKEAAVELGQYGIRVNCIAPGSIESERTRLEDPDYAGTWSRLTPLGRVGIAADIAPTVVFLASKGGSFISGQTIWIDGALFTKAQWPYKK